MDTLLRKLYGEGLDAMAWELRQNGEYRECLIQYLKAAEAFHAHLSPEDWKRFEKMNGYEDKMLDMMEFGAFSLGFRMGMQMSEGHFCEKEP